MQTINKNSEPLSAFSTIDKKFNLKTGQGIDIALNS